MKVSSKGIWREEWVGKCPDNELNLNKNLDKTQDKALGQIHATWDKPQTIFKLAKAQSKKLISLK